MIGLHPILILAVAFLAVFLESWFNGFRGLLGAQIDILPALLVYAGLNNGLFTVALAGICGGLWYDSLSANPLGVSVLPLTMIGLVTYRAREVLARDHPAAQFALGAAACSFQPLAVLFILLNIGDVPPLSWKLIWQWAAMTLGGGLLTPVLFGFFDRVHRAFDYQPATPSSFRPDRQIKRGRV